MRGRMSNDLPARFFESLDAALLACQKGYAPDSEHDQN
jgi:hypothetical protein